METLWQGLLLALRALGRNLLRSTLTIMGLLIGVAAVIVVTGLTNGASDFIGRRLNSLGTNIIVIFPPQGTAHGKPIDLTDEDAVALRREIPTVQSVAPIVADDVELGDSELRVKTRFFGTTLAFFEIKDWKSGKGSIWTPTEEITKAKVCVLGATVARQLYPNGEDPVGKTIRIGQYPHRIVGVLEEKGRDFQGQDQDNRVMLPIGSARMRLIKSEAKNAVSFIIASTASPAASRKALRQIAALLHQRRRFVGASECRVLSQTVLLQIRETAVNALLAFLVCVAAMSLLVGGIGVMNIMLVSVTERTKEIGIRLAVGASKADVLTQFLVEAATLAALGGALGVAFGRMVLVGFEIALHWSMPVSPFAMLLSLGVSAFTGVTFGFAPALRAAQLDPIEALRRE